MAIPTILGGLWGMNVALPFQDDPRGFLYVVLITAGLIASAVYIFRRKDWL
jgi:magnesium transporter